MADPRTRAVAPAIPPLPPERSAGPSPWLTRATSTATLAASLAVVALLTLTPQGSGWAWGSPLVELRWYLTGLDSTATMLQLVGNLALLAVPAALTVLRWPRTARLPLLAGASLAMGTGIELLQRILPLGRVVSPVDAALNAVGAIAAGLLAAHLRAIFPPGQWTTTVPLTAGVRTALVVPAHDPAAPCSDQVWVPGVRPVTVQLRLDSGTVVATPSTVTTQVADAGIVCLGRVTVADRP